MDLRPGEFARRLENLRQFEVGALSSTNRLDLLIELAVPEADSETEGHEFSGSSRVVANSETRIRTNGSRPRGTERCSMRQPTTGLLALVAALLVVLPPMSRVSADDAKTKPKAKAKAVATAKQPASDDDNIPTYNLLEAMNQGLVGVEASGRGDGRMTVSVTNNTKKQLRVVLPPGIIAQGATGQFGGMGGMGGGMGGMGGGMGGMGGGMMGGMGGMGGGMMGGGARTMPPTMGMMMLSRLIMYLCGDYDSWDQRSLSIGIDR